MYRVGIDIGGTFTDMLLVGEDGTAVIGKTLTTPGDPSLAVENALRPVLENGAVKTGERGTLIHGTTLVTNALIERKGAPTALLTTVGFRDAVEIGREHRYELYDLNLDLAQTSGAAPFALRRAGAHGRRRQRAAAARRRFCPPPGRRAARQGHQSHRRLLSQQFSQSRA